MVLGRGHELTRPEVLELQRLLRDQQYIVGPLDGIVGKLTRLGVVRYQKDKGVAPSGEVTRELLQELRLLPKKPLCLPAGLPDNHAALWIELLKHRAVLFVKGQYYAVYLVGIGKVTTPSPFGRWRVKNRSLNPGGPFGSRWLGLDVPWGSYGVHGTNRPDTVGGQVSNGCIRMFNSDVAEIYEHLFEGAFVSFYGNPYGLSILRRELKTGDMGNDVYLLQEALAPLYHVNLDGVFGKDTERALRYYQGRQGLTESGMMDSATRERLFGNAGKHGS